METERRLAAILSADVVDYSRLMTEDEEATVRTLGTYREQVSTLIREHRGRLCDFSGDNFLAEFPSALDAVHCAIEIQRVLGARNASLPPERRMQFRIGAHMGDVRVEGERIFGDGVNIAARLEAMAEPGGICISATVHEQVRNRLEVAYDDMGDRAIKNMPDQVHVYRVQVESSAGSAKPAPVHSARAPGSSRARSSTRAVVLGGLAALLVVGAFLAWPRVSLMLEARALAPPENPALPDLPSIVVLPFANLSGDPEQEYFSDGITEDLTNALSGTSTLFVISRNSAFTYKGKPVKVEDVGRELGVRYVLEGSVRRAGNQVRITAQLIDATSGFHVWSSQFDRELEDIFVLQSEISEQILSAVGVNITDAELERVRRKPTESLTAYDAFTRGYYHFQRFRRKDLYEARRLFERAVELDPGYALAVAMLGASYSAEMGLMFTLDRGNLVHAKEYAGRALELDPGLPNPHQVLGTIAMNEGRYEAALAAFRRSSELAPNDPFPWIFQGAALMATGEPREAFRMIQRAMRLNPRLSDSPVFLTLLGGVYVATGREQEAVDVWEGAREAHPELIGPRLQLANYYRSNGRPEDAQAVVAEALAVNPDLTVAAVAQSGFRFRPPSDDYLENLRAAGLP